MSTVVDVAAGVFTTRPAARGKYLYDGSTKLWVRGVTYGAFRPDEEGREYQDVAAIECDFIRMAAAGFNAVRIPHTMPPRHLLDCAGLSPTIKDYRSFEPHGAYEARLRLEHGRKSSFWSLV